MGVDDVNPPAADLSSPGGVVIHTDGARFVALSGRGFGDVY
jgi:hypothetical protein